MRILFTDFDGVLNVAVGPGSGAKRFAWAPFVAHRHLGNPFWKTTWRLNYSVYGAGSSAGARSMPPAIKSRLDSMALASGTLERTYAA